MNVALRKIAKFALGAIARILPPCAAVFGMLQLNHYVLWVEQHWGESAEIVIVLAAGLLVFAVTDRLVAAILRPLRAKL